MRSFRNVGIIENGTTIHTTHGISKCGGDVPGIW